MNVTTYLAFQLDSTRIGPTTLLWIISSRSETLFNYFGKGALVILLRIQISQVKSLFAFPRFMPSTEPLRPHLIRSWTFKWPIFMCHISIAFLVFLSSMISALALNALSVSRRKYSPSLRSAIKIVFKFSSTILAFSFSKKALKFWSVIFPTDSKFVCNLELEVRHSRSRFFDDHRAPRLLILILYIRSRRLTCQVDVSSVTSKSPCAQCIHYLSTTSRLVLRYLRRVFQWVVFLRFRWRDSRGPSYLPYFRCYI